MAGKGDKRRPGDTEAYRSNWDKIFTRPVECPRCKEVELRPRMDGMNQCRACGHEEQ